MHTIRQQIDRGSFATWADRALEKHNSVR
jgi:hypothetical protein